MLGLLFDNKTSVQVITFIFWMSKKNQPFFYFFLGSFTIY
jgi:hypothetical protein